MNSSVEIARLLTGIKAGDRECESRLLSAVYDELRRLASAQLRKERPGHTLQPSALVHEVYLRMLGDGPAISWENRAHFFTTAAGTMRRILIDHARARKAAKRPDPLRRVDFAKALNATGAFSDEDAESMIALDAALDELARLDPRQARVVELRFFGGLTEEEIADVLGISTKTVQRDWKWARAWLRKEMTGSGE